MAIVALLLADANIFVLSEVAFETDTLYCESTSYGILRSARRALFEWFDLIWLKNSMR